jgi:hypothetical protein
MRLLYFAEDEYVQDLGLKKPAKFVSKDPTFAIFRSNLHNQAKFLSIKTD